MAVLCRNVMNVMCSLTPVVRLHMKHTQRSHNRRRNVIISSSSLDEYLLQPTAGRGCDGHNQASISPVSKYDMKLDEESGNRAR
jgi:hypothetical protein